MSRQNGVDVSPAYRVLEVTGGFVVRDKVYRLSRRYPTSADAVALCAWLLDRAAGYPKRDLQWPPDDSHAIDAPNAIT